MLNKHFFILCEFGKKVNNMRRVVLVGLIRHSVLEQILDVCKK